MLITGTEYLTPLGWDSDPRGKRIASIRDNKIVFEPYYIADEYETADTLDPAGFPAEGVFFEVNGGGSLCYCASDKQLLTLARSNDDELYLVELAEIVAKLRASDAYWGRHYTALEFDPPALPGYISKALGDIDWKRLSYFLTELFDYRWYLTKDRLQIKLAPDQAPPEFALDWMAWSDESNCYFVEPALITTLFVHTCLHCPDPFMAYLKENGSASSQRYRLKQFHGSNYLQLAASAAGYGTSLSKRPVVNAPLRSRSGSKDAPLSVHKKNPLTPLRDRVVIVPSVGRGFEVPERVVTRYRGSIAIL